MCIVCRVLRSLCSSSYTIMISTGCIVCSVLRSLCSSSYTIMISTGYCIVCGVLRSLCSSFYTIMISSECIVCGYLRSLCSSKWIPLNPVGFCILAEEFPRNRVIKRNYFRRIRSNENAQLITSICSACMSVFTLLANISTSTAEPRYSLVNFLSSCTKYSPVQYTASQLVIQVQYNIHLVHF